MRRATRVGSSQLAGANGDVDALFDQVGALVAEHELEPNLGIRGEELGDQLHPEDVEEVGRRRDANLPARHLAALTQLLRGFGQSLDLVGTARVERRTGVGQGELARGALHQAQTQLLLELLDAAARGVGRHAEPPCGRCEAAGANHLDEQRHVVEIQHDCSMVGRLKSRSAG
jgi:hypothetical protein